MVDPVTIGGALAAAGGTAPSWLPWVGAAGAAAGGAGSLLAASKGSSAPPNVNIPAPPGIVPAQTPNSKPQRKSQQAGFLSGAAMAQQSGAGGTSTGKSLLGA